MDNVRDKVQRNDSTHSDKWLTKEVLSSMGFWASLAYFLGFR